MPDFLLPDLGEGLEEAEVVTWHVRAGDPVSIDQVVVEVETAKAVVEVPVPYSGVVAELHAAPGATVRVGQPLISIADRPPAGGDSPAQLSEPGVVVPERSGNVLIGYGTPPSGPRRRRPSRRGTPGRLEPVSATASTHRAAASGPPGPVPSRGVAVISPLVRTFARDAGVDLSTVAGTGPSGVIRRQDVEREIAARASRQVPAPTGAAGDTRIPIHGLRRAVSQKLSRSRREIPEATVWVDVDATELLGARAALNAATPHPSVSLLALLGRFTVLALRRHPELNGRIDGDEIVIPSYVNLGFAAQTERGLVVPVVHDAHQMTTRDLASALTARTAAARSGQLTPAQMTGGTITINNYGVFGVDGSAAIINHPEVAIVGMGRIIDRPWVVDGEVTVRKITELTLAFDHRVCDGGVAGGFLRFLADCVEHPITVLGDL